MVDILHEVGINASPSEVYKALATREGVAGWWANETRGDSKVGSVLTFRFTMQGVGGPSRWSSCTIARPSGAATS